MIDQHNTSDRRLAQLYVALAMMRKVAEESNDRNETIRSVLSLLDVASDILETVIVSSGPEDLHVELDQQEVDFLM